MSETPETDIQAAMVDYIYSHGYEAVVPVEFCRAMEKERNEARELAEQWRDSSLWVSNRLKPKAFPWEIPTES